MARKNYKAKTYAITAAQGIQNPQSANNYGRESRRGAPNRPFIKNLEHYVALHEGELLICAVNGSYVNEYELHEFFHDRDDVYAHKMAKKRNEQNKIKERERREKWYEQKWRAEDKGRVFTTPFPMQYFWKNIPDTDYKTDKVRFNSNIHLHTSQTPQQNKDPLRSKKEETHKYGGNSIIMPATRQIVQPVAKGMSDDFPRVMMTTGACTEPSFNTANTKGEEAYNRHETGCAVVDVLDNRLFLPRPVPAMKNGTFVDLGIKYAPKKKPEKAKTTAMVLGDPHVAHLDTVADAATEEMMIWLRPRHTYVGDSFDGETVNRHELEDKVREMNNYEDGLTNLEEELVLTGEWLKKKALLVGEWGGELAHVFDNHSQFLYQWLAKGHYRHDKENRRTAYRLLGQRFDKFNILEVALRQYVDFPNNITFLGPTDDRIHWGIQCAAHGHLGPNGTRGTLKNLKESLIRIAHGHNHQWLQDQGSGSAGTLAKRPMYYQMGQPSTSMAANLAIYEPGLLQGIPIINGVWHKPGFNDCLEKRL